MHGYAGKILHVDLGQERFWTEALSGEKIRKFVGGRGINAALLWEYLEPGVDPLGEKNVLVFGTGPLNGTLAPASGRGTVSCKGPATGLYLKSSAGGHWGPELKSAGYDHLVVHGAAKKPVYLWIRDQVVEIRDASRLWGRGLERTEEMIREDLGEDRVEIACIGPAGENGVLFAAVMFSHCAAGRGGAGAVMGAKNLKAVAIQGHRPIYVADPESFFECAMEGHKILAEFPARKGLMMYGTAGLAPLRNEMHLLPTRNWQESHMEDTYKISGQYLAEAGYLTHRIGCSACGTSCHRYTQVSSGNYQGTHSAGPEYETVASLGAGCGMTDTEALLEANALCNRYGLDTISTGGVIQWAMECFEKGVLTLDETQGMDLSWGNPETVVGLIHKIAFREGIGNLLARGVKRAAETLGKDSWKWAIQAKGLEMSRSEVRARKGYALALAVNPRGPDHLHSQVYAEDGTTPEARALIKMITGSEAFATHVLPDKRGHIVRWHEDCYAVTDCLGLCTFVTLSRGYLITPEQMTRMYTSATGMDTNPEELFTSGRRVMNLEKALNMREGATRKDDTLPWRFMNEPVRSGPFKGMITSRDELDRMLDEYYGLHGWDVKTGQPTRDILETLGLHDVADQLEQMEKLPGDRQ